MKLSIVIPTLNEAANLSGVVKHTRKAAGESLEIVVSDCDSRDQSVSIAANNGAVFLDGACCRACAMNRGAAKSEGDVLLFLHADTLLPQGFVRIIQRAIDGRGCVGGAFDFNFAKRTPLLDWIVLINRIRFRWSGNFYGDQCIFVRRDIFDRIGGFPHVRLMEDISFSRKMRRFGRVAILRPPVRTSPRRFISRGVVRQFATDLAVLAIDNLGCRSSKIWDHYNDWNRSTQRRRR